MLSIIIILIITYSLYFLYKKYQKPKIISIEGNIGSGKSTLVAILQQKYKNIHFLQEPVSIWTNLKNTNGIDILTLFYSDKERWGYTFQNMAFITRFIQLENLLQHKKHNTIVSERSIHTDSNVFRKMLYHNGLIDTLENDLYELWFNHFKTDNHYFIYLNTSVDNCYNRIRNRNRKGEEKIEKTYLTALDTYHNDWLKNHENVLTLDGNGDFHHDEAVLKKLIYQIDEFINKI